MKNNKKTIYILAPLVLFIWGMIVYRILNFSSDDEEMQISKGIGVNISNDNQIDTFKLYLSYSDPFLSKDYLFQRDIQEDFNEEEEDKNGKVQAETAFKNPLQNAFWPKIEFLGIAMNTQDGKKVVVVTINKKEYLMSENDAYENVKLIEVFKDSLIMEFNNEKQTFKRFK